MGEIERRVVGVRSQLLQNVDEEYKGELNDTHDNSDKGMGYGGEGRREETRQQT